MILRDYILSLGIHEPIFDSWIHSVSDKEILGSLLQEADRNHETVQGKETYAWYRAFAEFVKPRVIAEIGVRYGYTLKALSVSSVQAVHGFDNESYISGSLSVVKEHFPEGHFTYCNSQLVETLPITDVDIFHVDGDHTSMGAYHDLLLAYKCVREGGYILIDDVKGLYYQTRQDYDVRQAAEQFCTKFKLNKVFVPTYRGLFIIQK